MSAFIGSDQQRKNMAHSHTSLGNRFFTAAGPRLWNNLPFHTCDSELRLAPLSERTSLNVRHSLSKNFTVLPAQFTNTLLSTNGMNQICLCFPSRSWSSWEGWKAELAWAPPLRWTVCPRPIRVTAVRCSNRQSSLGKDILEYASIRIHVIYR